MNSLTSRKKTPRRLCQLSVGRDELRVDAKLGRPMPLPDKVRSLEIRKSMRWAIEDSKRVFDFPLISNVGKFTGTSVGRFECYPAQHISTIVATIASRLWKRALRYQKHHVLVKHQRLLLGAAYYYAMSKNSWFMDRILFLSKDLESNWRQVQFLTVHFISKQDDYNRFVYSQVLFQTNWLLFRACRPRDKSMLFTSVTSVKWSKAKTLSSFYKKGLSFLRVMAFRQVSSDTSEISGPEIREAPHYLRGFIESLGFPYVAQPLRDAKRWER